MIKHLKPRPKWQILFNRIIEFRPIHAFKKWKLVRMQRKVLKIFEDDLIKELSRSIDKQILEELLKNAHNPTLINLMKSRSET